MLRLILLSLLSIACCVHIVLAQSRGDVEAYVARYRATALQYEKEYGIPAPIILAQGILESAAGTSSLTKASNNHFCIKAGLQWNGPIYLAWDDESEKSSFRSYSSASESYRDYALLLSTSATYRALFEINVYDYRRWAYGLKKAGYATAPNYATALIGIIDQYKLYAINGGVKLRPGKIVVVTKYVESDKPVFDTECVAAEEETSQEQEVIMEAMKFFAVEINGIHCTILQPGETLASISRRHNMPYTALLEYNEIASERTLREGAIIFLDKKKKKYMGAQDFYIAKGGETLYDVSQLFGIRLHQLAKLNKLNDYIRLEKGTRIALK